MDGVREAATHVLVGTLLAAILVEAVLGATLGGRLLRRLAAEPRRRGAVYCIGMGLSWLRGGLVALTVVASAEISATDVGLRVPRGDGLDYAFAAYVLVVVVIGGLRLRRRMQRGRRIPFRAALAPLLPQTAFERRLAAGMSLSAGVTEEMLFRGLLIAAGTRLYHVPVGLVVVVSLALFVAAHTYQGLRAMAEITVFGAFFTFIYLMSGSLLLPIVVHVALDLVALLVVPAYPTVTQAPGGTNVAGDPGPDPEIPVSDEAGPAPPGDETSPQAAPLPGVRPAHPG